MHAAHMAACGPEYKAPVQAADLDSLITYFRAGVARKPPDILWREWSVDDDRPQVKAQTMSVTQWQHIFGVPYKDASGCNVLLH